MTDAQIQARILEILDQAGTEAGTQASATEGSKKGPLTASAIRSLVSEGIQLQRIERLLSELTDATTIVRAMNSSPDTAKWTYSAP
jgi:hypothetical protein